MGVQITVVSGFLGAGKSTLIQSLLQNESFAQTPVLIENDYGSLPFKQDLLKKTGLVICDRNVGCICCSGASDFVKTVGQLIALHHPQNLIIEPSGTGKLSEILTLLRDEKIKNAWDILSVTAITVVDLRKFQHNDAYVTEYFWDQIRWADFLMLNHSSSMDLEEYKRVCHLIRQHHMQGRILKDTDLSALTMLKTSILDAPLPHSAIMHSKYMKAPGDAITGKRQLRGIQISAMSV